MFNFFPCSAVPYLFQSCEVSAGFSAFFGMRLCMFQVAHFSCYPIVIYESLKGNTGASHVTLFLKS